MNITRLRELCDAFDKGALRGEEMRELVGLARQTLPPCCDGSSLIRFGCMWTICSDCTRRFGVDSQRIQSAAKIGEKRNAEHGVSWSISKGIQHIKPCNAC